jgi:hypothetical protein
MATRFSGRHHLGATRKLREVEYDSARRAQMHTCVTRRRARARNPPARSACRVAIRASAACTCSQSAGASFSVFVSRAAETPSKRRAVDRDSHDVGGDVLDDGVRRAAELVVFDDPKARRAEDALQLLHPPFGVEDLRHTCSIGSTSVRPSYSGSPTPVEVAEVPRWFAAAVAIGHVLDDVARAHGIDGRVGIRLVRRFRDGARVLPSIAHSDTSVPASRHDVRRANWSS